MHPLRIKIIYIIICLFHYLGSPLDLNFDLISNIYIFIMHTLRYFLLFLLKITDILMYKLELFCNATVTDYEGLKHV